MAIVTHFPFYVFSIYTVICRNVTLMYNRSPAQPYLKTLGQAYMALWVVAQSDSLARCQAHKFVLATVPWQEPPCHVRITYMVIWRYQDNNTLNSHSNDSGFHYHSDLHTDFSSYRLKPSPPQRHNFVPPPWFRAHVKLFIPSVKRYFKTHPISAGNRICTMAALTLEMNPTLA